MKILLPKKSKRSAKPDTRARDSEARRIVVTSVSGAKVTVDLPEVDEKVITYSGADRSGHQQ